MKKLLLLAAICMVSPAQAESPYAWGAALTLESVSNLDGGLKEGTRELSNLDLTLAIDTEAAGWWANGEIFIYALGDYGNNPSDYVGDVQGVSNIAADNAAKIYELWYQHSFIDDSIKLLFGLHDYNSVFYSLDSAGLFTHPSFGIGPDTSQVGPSIFSTTATGVVLTLEEGNQYLLGAIYDGIAGDPENPRGTHIRFDEGDGVFSAVEFGIKEESDYKMAVGVWQHTAEVENPIDASPSDDNQGFYVIGEKVFEENIAVFVQLGQADDQTNQIENYLGTGVTVSNVWRTDDNLGVAVAHARNGDPFAAVNPELDAAETAWELTYFVPAIEHIHLQTSLYYIQNPAMEPTTDDALAVGARIYWEL